MDSFHFVLWKRQLKLSNLTGTPCMYWKEIRNWIGNVARLARSKKGSSTLRDIKKHKNEFSNSPIHEFKMLLKGQRAF